MGETTQAIESALLGVASRRHRGEFVSDQEEAVVVERKVTPFYEAQLAEARAGERDALDERDAALSALRELRDAWDAMHAGAGPPNERLADAWEAARALLAASQREEGDDGV